MANRNQLTNTFSLKNANQCKPPMSETTRMKMVQHERQALHFKLRFPARGSVKGTMLLQYKFDAKKKKKRQVG